MNKLLFNDNLNVLLEHISDKSEDLIYLKQIPAKRRSTHSPECSEAKPWEGGVVDGAGGKADVK